MWTLSMGVCRDLYMRETRTVAEVQLLALSLPSPWTSAWPCTILFLRSVRSSFVTWYLALSRAPIVSKPKCLSWNKVVYAALAMADFSRMSGPTMTMHRAVPMFSIQTMGMYSFAATSVTTALYSISSILDPSVTLSSHKVWILTWSS